MTGKDVPEAIRQMAVYVPPNGGTRRREAVDPLRRSAFSGHTISGPNTQPRWRGGLVIKREVAPVALVEKFNVLQDFRSGKQGSSQNARNSSDLCGANKLSVVALVRSVNDKCKRWSESSSATLLLPNRKAILLSLDLRISRPGLATGLHEPAGGVETIGEASTTRNARLLARLIDTPARAVG